MATDRLETVRALIAKAESTEFPDEAKAFLDKASELMARYTIDDAMLRRSAPETAGKPTHKDVWVLKPYAMAKRDLLNAVAKNNGCRLIGDGLGAKGRPGALCHLFGFQASIEQVEMMYAALELEAARELSAAIIAGHGIGEHGKRFTNAFLTAFAIEVGRRMAEARRAAESSSGTSMALVLRDDLAAVDSLIAQEVGPIVTSRRSVSSSSGWGAGRAAGGRVNLNPSVGNNSGKSLTR